MRVKVGRKVDIDKDVNLSDLSPLDKIIASAENAYRSTNFYKRRYAETQEKIEEYKRKVKESLINNLLTIAKQMQDNIFLEKKNDTCVGLLVSIPNRYSEYLEDVIRQQEFMQYNIIIIPPNKTFLKFCKAPYLLYIEHRDD